MGLTVSEYMPLKLRRLEYMLRIVCIMGILGAVGMFDINLAGLKEQKQFYMEMERSFQRYDQLLADSRLMMEEGNYEQAEEDLRRAAVLLPGEETAYWELAALYEKIREYEKAIRILGYFAAEKEKEQEEKLLELRELVGRLEQSVFIMD